MNGRDRSTLLLGLGAALIRLAASDRVLLYVRPTSRPYLLAGGAMLLLLGGLGLLNSGGRRSPEAAGPRVGYLALVPILALLLIRPPDTGALVGARRQAAPIKPSRMPGLTGPEPVPIRISELVQRAVWAPRSLVGHRLRVVGFLSRSARSRDGPLVLGRLSITCCAADAQEDDIAVTVPGSRPTREYVAREWLVVTGRFAGTSDGDRFVPVLNASDVEPTAAPADPYD